MKKLLPVFIVVLLLISLRGESRIEKQSTYKNSDEIVIIKETKRICSIITNPETTALVAAKKIGFFIKDKGKHTCILVKSKITSIERVCVFRDKNLKTNSVTLKFKKSFKLTVKTLTAAFGKYRRYNRTHFFHPINIIYYPYLKFKNCSCAIIAQLSYKTTKITEETDVEEISIRKDCILIEKVKN